MHTSGKCFHISPTSCKFISPSLMKKVISYKMLFLPVMYLVLLLITILCQIKEHRKPEVKLLSPVFV